MRDFSDPWEPEDIFDRQAAAELRDRMEASASQHAAQLKHDADMEALAKENGRLLSIRASGSVMMTEYARAGVQPLETNGKGVPLVSLPLLLWMGWTIEEISGERKLIRPHAREHQRKRREDYGHDQGS